MSMILRARAEAAPGPWSGPVLFKKHASRRRGVAPLLEGVQGQEHRDIAAHGTIQRPANLAQHPGADFPQTLVVGDLGAICDH